MCSSLLSWLLDHVICLTMRRKQLLYKAEQIKENNTQNCVVILSESSRYFL